MPELAKKHRGARVLLNLACLVVVVAGLRAAGPILVPLCFAILLSILSMPLFSWLLSHRIPKLIAVLVTVLANFAAAAALLLPVGGSVNAFTAEIPKYQERLEEMISSSFTWLETKGIDTSELAWLDLSEAVDEQESPELTTPEALEEEMASALRDGTRKETSAEGLENGPAFFNIGRIIDLMTRTVKGVATVVSKALLVFLIMIFILFEAAGLPRKLELVLGWQSEDHARLYKAKREIQHYLGIKTLVSLVTGTLVGLWVWLLGVDFALLWGLLAFVLNYIPTLGSLIASVPVVLLTLIDGGLGRALLVAIGYLVVNLVFGNFVEPHLMGRRLGISTLVVFLSLIFWGWLWGPSGMLLAVPLTMTLKISLENTEDLRWLGRLLGVDPGLSRPS